MGTGNIPKEAQWNDEELSPGSAQARPPTRDEMTALLELVAATSRRGADAGRALTNLVRVLSRCPWLQGEVRTEIAPFAPDQSTVHIYCEHEGTRERALPPVVFDVSCAELQRELKDASHAPVRIKSGTHRRRVT